MTETAITEVTPGLRAYLPRLVADWATRTPAETWRELEGSLVSVDLSGFTALSERLAAKGRAGTEELILVISGVFEGLIGITRRHGGDVLKFRGDALLLLFDGEAHELRAARAACDMQWFIESAGSTMSSVGPVSLRMAAGVYTGPLHFFVVDGTHRELIVTGPGTTGTFRLEDAAEAGEVLVGEATASALPGPWLGERRPEGVLVARPQGEDDPSAEPPLEEPAADDILVDYVPAQLRSQLLYARGEAEHRQATVAFVKFSGIDDVIAAEGARGAHERLQGVTELVSKACDELGITWLESDIDVNAGKIYLTAGAPSSTGSDEESMLRGLRAILDARAAPLPLRAGINRGPVFAGDIGGGARRTYAVMGDTVNLAARLVARAEPGQALATGDVLERSRTLFETETQPFLMKGKERAVTAYRVGTITGTRPQEAAQMLPIIGREAELERLRAAVDAARMRQGALIEIVGETGIGKTRLVEELKTLAVGFNPLVAECERYTSTDPFSPFRANLRLLAGITPEQSPEQAGTQLAPWFAAVMPDLAPWLPLLATVFDAVVEPTPETDGLDPKFRQDRLHESLEQFLMRMFLMPTLLVIEDGQWLDDASRHALRHLTRTLLGKPWLVCVTRRPEGEAIDPEGAADLALEPLSPEGASELALAAAGDVALATEAVELVAERSGGNPLFVRELVAATRDGTPPDTLPESVESLLTERIDTLDAGDRMLLRSAAVVGRGFDLELLADVLRGELDDVGDMVRWERLGGFVAWHGEKGLQFRQDLFRATAYEGLSFRRRRDLHLRVAEALERRAGARAEEEAAVLSLHFHEGEAYEPAWRYAVRAGERAQASYANLVAAELYERALAAAEHLELPTEEVALVAEALGDVCELAGAYDRADRAYERAGALTEGDRLREAALMRKRGVLGERMGDYDEALARYERALAALAAAGDEAPATKAGIELGYAGVKHRQGDFETAAERAERAVELARRAEAVSELGRALFLLDVARTRLGRPDPSLREEARALLREAGDPVGEAGVANNAGVAAYYAGRWDEALRLYRESGELSARAGDVVSAARAANNEAEILSDQGYLEEAEPLLAEALRVFRAAGYPVGVALVSSNLGRLAARAGRFDEARDLLARAAEGFAEIGAESLGDETDARRVERFVLEGSYKEARELAEASLERPGVQASGALVAMLERLAGYAIVQAREGAEAATGRFEASIAAARGLDVQYELALSLRGVADTGCTADADTARRESEAILESLGIVRLPRIPLP